MTVIKQGTKHRIVALVWNSCLTWCKDAPKYSKGGLTWALNLKLGPWNWKLQNGISILSCILLLYPFNTNVNVIIQNPLHYQDVTTWCSNDAMICCGWNVCTCTWSTEWKQLLWVEMPKWMLWALLSGREKWWPQADTMTLICLSNKVRINNNILILFYLLWLVVILGEDILFDI